MYEMKSFDLPAAPMQNEAPKTASTIDEALEKTKFGRFNIQMIVFSGLVLNNVVLESVGMSFAMPVATCDLKLSYQQKGILGAVCFLGIIVSSHFWGFLADTRGRKAIMRPALLIGFAITCISSLSVNFLMMAILRFLNGIFLSAGSATILAYLGEFHCQKDRNNAILYSSLICALGVILIPGIAWVFINQDWSLHIPLINVIYKPWRLYILVCGVSGFCCGLTFFVLPESPKYLLSINKSEQALRVLKMMHRINTRGAKNLSTNDEFKITTLLGDADTPIHQLDNETAEESTIQKFFQLMWTQTVPLFNSEHLRKTLLGGIIQFFAYFSAHGVYIWLPYILNQTILYTDMYPMQGKSLCDIIRFTHSANFTSSAVSLQLETFEVNDNGLATIAADTCISQFELSTYKHTAALEIIYAFLILIIIAATSRFDRIPILFITAAGCGLCGVLSILIDIPLAAIYLFLIFLCSGLISNVLNAIIVDLYPTNLRAMAVCISLMFGRIGSVTGSNMMGALINTKCEAGLYTATIGLIAVGFLGFLLPKVSSESKAGSDVKNQNVQDQA